MCFRRVTGVLASVFLLNAPAYATPLNFLNVDSGAFLYASSSYDIKDSVTSAGPTLSETFGTPFSYTDPSVAGSMLSGNYLAAASASYGVLHGKISSTFNGTGNPGRSVPLISVFTGSFFEDTLTISTPSPEVGTMLLLFSIHGTGSGPSADDGSPGVHGDTWGGFLAGAAGTAQHETFIDTLNTTVALTATSDRVAFISGTPVTISASLGPALSMACNTGLVGAPCVSWTGTAFSDFGDTAILSGIELFDAAGHPINDFSITSSSGTEYTPNGVAAVPEPATLMLTALGLAGVVRRYRHRRFQ